jgi:uncharacterized membrane protein
MEAGSPHTEKTSTGLDANLAAALAYLLWFITGIVFLILERDNRFVRFHAMQSTIVFVAIFVLNIVLQVLPIFGALLTLFVVWPLSVALWLVLMFKAFQGEYFKLPVVGDIADQKI